MRGVWVLCLGAVGCGPAVSLDVPEVGTAGSTGVPDAPEVPVDPTSSGPSVPGSTTGLDESTASSGSSSSRGSSSASGTSSSTGEPGLPGAWSRLFEEEIFSIEVGPDGLHIESIEPNNPDFGLRQIRRLNDDGTPDPTFGDGGSIEPGPWDVDRDTGELVVARSGVRRYGGLGQPIWVRQVQNVDSVGPVAAAGPTVYAMTRDGAIVQMQAFDALTGAPAPGFLAPDLVGPLGASPTSAQLVVADARVFAGITPDDIASSILFRFSELDGATGSIVQSGVTAAISTHVEALFVTNDTPHWVGSLPPHADPSWSPLFADEPTTHEPMQVISSVVATDEAVFFGGWTNSKDWRVERRDPITLELDPGFGEDGVIQDDDGHDTRVLDVDVFGDWLYFVYRSLASENKGWVVERRRQSDGAL